MRLLLDTHAFLWFIDGNAKLSPRAKDLIEDEANTKSASMASLWEIGIKASIGRLHLGEPFEHLIPRQLDLNGFAVFPVRLAHIAKVVALPFHHRDPFDRMLAAQCLAEALPIVSADPIFDKYLVPRLW